MDIRKYNPDIDQPIVIKDQKKYPTIAVISNAPTDNYWELIKKDYKINPGDKVFIFRKGINIPKKYSLDINIVPESKSPNVIAIPIISGDSFVIIESNGIKYIGSKLPFSILKILLEGKAVLVEEHHVLKYIQKSFPDIHITDSMWELVKGSVYEHKIERELLWETIKYSNWSKHYMFLIYLSEGLSNDNAATEYLARILQLFFHQKLSDKINNCISYFTSQEDLDKYHEYVEEQIKNLLDNLPHNVSAQSVPKRIDVTINTNVTYV